jgi:gliding motility-associated-like protein
MPIRYFNVLFIPFFCVGLSLQAQYITTVGGNGYTGNVGDDGPATCAGIPNPSGICIDKSGFLYLTCSNMIRKINLSANLITRVAGSDTWGNTGDGGQAKDALFQNPYSLCTDNKNNLFISEFVGNRIRKINLSTGIISTYAGTGTGGFSGDGVAANLTNLNQPKGICTDLAGNLYIADYGNHRIRKVDAATGIITTIAGNDLPVHSGDGGLAIAAGTAFPNSIATDATGNIYFAEFNATTSRIRKINFSTGIISTIAGNNNSSFSGDGGPAVNSELFRPEGLTIDLNGNIYISESGDSRVRVIDASTGIINTIAGNGINAFAGDGGFAINGSMDNPLGLINDSNGNLYIADKTNHRIRKISISAAAPPVLPTKISISTPNLTTCEGSPVSFTATATNPGFNAIYQWRVNDIPVDVIQSVFTTTLLKNGDIVTCVLKAIVCNQNIRDTSNSILMTVKPGLAPSVVINASDTSICSGTNITFIATVQNTGSNPAYQWKLNGSNVGTNSNSFNNASLAHGDTISCVVTASAVSGCASSNIVPSNKIGVEVKSGIPPTISITASALEICKGSSVLFSSEVSNANNSPSYQWKLNGKNVGTNYPTYSNANLSDNDMVICMVMSNGSTCNSLPVSSQELRIKVKSPPGIIIFPRDTLVAPGTQVRINAVITGQYSRFEWLPANLLNNPGTLSPTTVSLNNSADFILNLTSPEGCTSTSVSSIRIYRKLFMPTAFTPNGDHINDIYRIPPGVTITLDEFSIFDRWGNKLFTTNNINQGWNGTEKGLKSAIGGYIYLIRGYDDKGKIMNKGTFALIR